MAKRPEKVQENIVRILGTGVSGEKTLVYGLSQIKGISIMFASALCHVLKLDKNQKIAELSEKDIEKIEEFLTSGKELTGIPKWLLNQRKEHLTGADKHFVTKDIDYSELQLRRRLGKIKSYKGLRLRLGLTVRGQRTKSNFRKNKTLAAKKAKTGGGKK